MRPVLALAVAAAAVLSFASAERAAAEYPDKTITIVVNSAAGGSADTLARILSAGLGERLKTSVVVENRPGAGGSIAGSEVARAEPDGYTVVLGDSGMLVINPELEQTSNFDPATDLLPVVAVAEFPTVITAFPGSGLTDLNTLIEKAKTEEIAYASPGIGSPQHLTAEMLRSATGLKLLHVPYKGGAAAITDMITGRIPLSFSGLPLVAPYVQRGELVGLGISTAQPSTLLPETPPIASVVPGFETSVWFAILAPKGTPENVAHVLSDAIEQVVNTDKVSRQLIDLGYAPMTDRVQDLGEYMTSQRKLWADVIVAAGIGKK